MTNIYKLRDWIRINFNNLDLHLLSANPNAIYLLEKNINQIHWTYLSVNPNAIQLLEINMETNDQAMYAHTAMDIININLFLLFIYAYMHICIFYGLVYYSYIYNNPLQFILIHL